MLFSVKTLNKAKSLLLNKYVIVFLSFTIFVAFFDEHSLFHRWQSYRKISLMNEELNYYREEIKATKQKKNELKSSNENLEKFAREQYNMKNANEDIFIIKE